jgi:uncharacterized membrane protein
LGGDEPQAIVAGGSVTYTFALENDGPTDIFDMELTGNAWPTTILGSEAVTLTQGVSATIQVRVDVPDDASGGDAFTLEATSRHIPGVLMTVAATTTVTIMADVALGADSLQSVGAGESVTHTFTLTNEGSADVIYLSVSGNAWPTAILGSDVVTLTQGMTATIQVRVDVPAGTSGEVDTFTLKATSGNDSEVWDMALGTTQALWRLFLPLILQNWLPNP